MFAPVKRVAMEKRGTPVALTHESNPGEVWEETEFWIALSWKIAPDGSIPPPHPTLLLERATLAVSRDRERLELAPEALAGGTAQVPLEGLARLEAVDEEVAEPTLLVALLEAAALRPEEARLADDLRHVLLLEPAEVALAAVGRDPDLHHVEDRCVHVPL